MSEEKEQYVTEPKRVVLTREAILEQKDERSELIEVPEWGTWLRIRSLTVSEVNNIVYLSSSKKGKLNTMDSAIYTFIRGVMEPKFTDEDVDALKKKSAIVLRVVKEINRVSGIADDSAEDAEKN